MEWWGCGRGERGTTGVGFSQARWTCSRDLLHDIVPVINTHAWYAYTFINRMYLTLSVPITIFLKRFPMDRCCHKLVSTAGFQVILCISSPSFSLSLLLPFSFPPTFHFPLSLWYIHPQTHHHIHILKHNSLSCKYICKNHFLMFSYLGYLCHIH